MAKDIKYAQVGQSLYELERFDKPRSNGVVAVLRSHYPAEADNNTELKLGEYRTMLTQMQRHKISREEFIVELRKQTNGRDQAEHRAAS